MKTWIGSIVCLLLTISITGCSTGTEKFFESETDVQSSSQMETERGEEVSKQNQTVLEPEVTVADEEEIEDINKQISIQTENGDTLVFELNDSAAASSLYEQLLLSVEVKDFSTNEKIFYLTEKLDITDTSTAEMSVGTLAYYAPWGNVVMFYDEYSPNGDLYELGHIITGFEKIEILSGQLQISGMG